jgi:hypothetical protein
MDSEFSKLVDDADSIKTSGRWAAVNEEIKRLAENPDTGNSWYVELFCSLCYIVFSEYLLIKNAHTNKQRGDGPLLAWRARNLLELLVWSTYCSKSRDNARRLYEDAGRDALDVFGAFKAWGEKTAQSTDWLDAFTSAGHDLSQRAALVRIETLDGSYKRVADASKECGIADHYALSFKMLSKFAHPTAMQILAPRDEERDTKQRDYFFSQGCLFFTGAFVELEQVVKSSGYL